MANYTTTKFTTKNKIGNSTFFNNLSDNSGFMIITPNNGFVVSASDFSTSTLPDTISTVTFSDTGVAGKVGNKVVVVATFSDTFVVSKNSKISIKVNGDAKLFNETSSNINFSLTVIDDRNKSSNGTSLFTSDNYSVNIDNNVGVDGKFDIVKNVFTGSITKNKLTKIGSLSVSANSGFKFVKKPTLKLTNIDFIIKIKCTGKTLDTNKNITGYTFDLFLKTNENIGKNIAYIFYSAVAIPTITREVKNLYVKRSRNFQNTEIKDVAQKIKLQVSGDAKADFDITVTKDSDGTSILNSFNSSVFTPDGTINSIRKVLTTNYTICSVDLDIPKPTAVSTTVNGAVSNSTTVNVADKTGIEVGDKIIAPGIKAGKTVKVATIVGGHDRVTTTEAVTLSNGVDISFNRLEKYHINIYPRPGTTLASAMPSSRPHFTINQRTEPILKLQATSSHATSNPADIIFTGKANTQGSDLVGVLGADGSTATQTDRKNYFKITYTFTASSGNWTTSGKQALTWSSSDQSASRWTNSVYFDTSSTVLGNKGTHIEISNIKLSGTGTNTATLTANVLIKKFGTDDVTMVFDADNCFEDGA